MQSAKRIKFLLTLIAILSLSYMNAYALKFDVNAQTELKASNYNQIPYGNQTYSQGMFTENTKLQFKVLDIVLEKTQDSTMDMSITLQSVSGLSSSNTITAPQFLEAQKLLPYSDGTPYIREAYVKINNFLFKNFTAILGRQDFTLGQGITLGTDNVGFTGARFKSGELFWGYAAELFYFRPSYNNYDYNVYGAMITNTTPEGNWQLYHFIQNNSNSIGNIKFGEQVTSESKNFTGIRYSMQKNHIGFDGEASMQNGSADLASGKSGDYSGYAFMMKGSWQQDIYFFQKTKARLAYGKSSGNGSAIAYSDNAFYSELAPRYNGFERNGYGMIAGATLFDMIKLDNTENGLPAGYSGLTIVNGGIDIPYKKIVLSADYFKFKSENINSTLPIFSASEVDVKLTYPMGENLSLQAAYAIFTPDIEGIKASNAAYFLINAKF